MKILKSLFFLLLLCFISVSTFAQKDKKAAKKQSSEMSQALEKVSDAQLKDLLWVLMEMNGSEPKAEALRIFEQLPAEKKEMAVYYTSILKEQKVKGAKNTAVAVPAPPKPKPTPPAIERKQHPIAKKQIQAPDPHAGHNHAPGVKHDVAPLGPLTSIEFAETSFDFGTIVAGDKISYSFSFKNTGKEPLLISNAKGSCGCTVPKWPKEPIAPGGTSEVTVVFDSKNKKGMRNQKVTLTANTDPAQSFIYLKGEVVTQ